MSVVWLWLWLSVTLSNWSYGGYLDHHPRVTGGSIFLAGLMTGSPGKSCASGPRPSCSPIVSACLSHLSSSSMTSARCVLTALNHSVDGSADADLSLRFHHSRLPNLAHRQPCRLDRYRYPPRLNPEPFLSFDATELLTCQWELSPRTTRLALPVLLHCLLVFCKADHDTACD